MNAPIADINTDPTVISLFAGCGGSSLGYKMAGYNELLAIDFNDNAIETFKLNFPGVPVWKKDISQLSGKEILSFCNIKKGDLDVLDGSPPCQGFSMAGKRKINDSRNELFNHNIRLIDELYPKVFVIENVKGLVVGQMKGLFRNYMLKLKKLNYNVTCKLMNVKYYNVPQSRERLIWIGVRKDLNLHPVYPSCLNGYKIITVKMALNELYDDIHDSNSTEYILNIMKKVPMGKNGSVVKGSGKYFDCIRLHRNKPANTIKKTFNKGWGAYFHPEQDRNLTINELKRIQSFPDDFKFIGKFEEHWARIGNSVPPLFMKVIAETIKKEIITKND